MPRFAIACGRIHLELDPDLGAGIADLSLLSPKGDPTPLIRRAPGLGFGSEQMGCFVMAPWTNRIRDARFAWDGRVHQLRSNHTDGTAIHGDVRDRPWRIRHRTPMSATLTFDSTENEQVNFPFPFLSRIRYEVAAGAVEIDLDVINAADRPVPLGCGLHPYFMRRLWNDDDQVELTIPLVGRYPADNCLPTGPAEPDDVTRRLASGPTLGDLELDDVFRVEAVDAAMHWLGSGVRARLTASSSAGHVVIYTPRSRQGSPSPREWFCVEPTTMVNDGFNLADAGWANTGVRVCEPGQGVSLRVRLAIEFA